MFFPTSLEMVVMLVAFVWCLLQQRLIQEAHSSSNLRLVVCAIYIGFMLIAVLYNGVNRWFSTALFLVSVAALGYAFHLYRRMPARLPRDPSF